MQHTYLDLPARVFRRMAANTEPLRLAVQTACGVALAYGAALAIGLPSPSWAVFSAIFVLHVSVGGTVGAAIQRVLGAAIGLGIGLVILYTIGFGGWRSFVSLSLGVGVMAVVAGYWPRYTYGLVTVTMLIAAPDYELLESALVRAGAITLGTFCGTLAGALVWPVRAHRRARQHMGRAIERCAELLDAALTRSRAREHADLQALHDQIGNEMHQAQDMIGQSRKRQGTENRAGRNSAVRREIDRLWYTLNLVDRSTAHPLAWDALRMIDEPTRKATELCGSFLRDFGRAFAQDGDLPAPGEAVNAIMDLVDATKELRRKQATLSLELRDVERLFSLSFAWEQLADNLRDLSDAATNKG